MQIVAPDILKEARELSPILSGAGLLAGFLLWSLGGRTHRFWLAMMVTRAAGLLGLSHGKQFGMQPLVAGLLLAVSAGALALSLVRILLFAAGGLAALGLLHLIAPGWDEPIAVFLVGGLIGVLLYKFWITTFSSLVGSLLMAYSALALFDRLHMVKSVEWTQNNGSLLNWAFASLVVTGVLVQFLWERRRRRKSRAAPVDEPEFVQVAPPPPAAKPARSMLWAWGERLLHRRAG
jgi:thiamine transporter ThiT